MTLFDFTKQKTVQDWHTQNDTVMGGVSSSQVTHQDDGARFSGDVSLENDGGFAQILYDKDIPDLSEFDGVEVQVKGDGKTYDVRMESDPKQAAYSHSFTAEKEWHTVRLPFENFEASHNGESVPDAPALDLADLKTIGLLIGDGQEGKFEIFVKGISGYKS